MAFTGFNRVNKTEVNPLVIYTSEDTASWHLAEYLKWKWYSRAIGSYHWWPFFFSTRAAGFLPDFPCHRYDIWSKCVDSPTHVFGSQCRALTSVMFWGDYSVSLKWGSPGSACWHDVADESPLCAVQFWPRESGWFTRLIDSLTDRAHSATGEGRVQRNSSWFFDPKNLLQFCDSCFIFWKKR